MNKGLLLSIIIPTKNRYSYLFKIIRILTSFRSNLFEIVIQDNSDNNGKVIDYLNELSDSRIKYFYFKENLSQADNSELAVKNAKGEYVCFIGDDDLVLEDIINIVTQLKCSGYDCLITNKPSYSWKDIRYKNLSARYSGLLVTKKYSGKYKILDSKKELRKSLFHGAQTILNLPQLYHGIVKKDILDKIYMDLGTYFPGPSPDMAIATTLCLYIKKYIKLDYPLIITGTSNSSAGGLGASNKHSGSIKAVTFLPEDTEKTWSNGVPLYWSGPTIYADSMLKALKANKNNSLIHRFNYNYLYARCLVFTPNYKELIFKELKSRKGVNKMTIGLFYLINWIKRIKSFLINRTSIFRRLFNRVYIFNVETISQAATLLKESIKNITIKLPY